MMRNMPNFSSKLEQGLANRWLVDPPKDRSLMIKVNPQHFADVDMYIKLTNLTTGYFHVNHWTVYFTEEADYVAFKLATTR